jgi:hypothetical protein
VPSNGQYIRIVLGFFMSPIMRIGRIRCNFLGKFAKNVKGSPPSEIVVYIHLDEELFGCLSILVFSKDGATSE